VHYPRDQRVQCELIAVPHLADALDNTTGDKMAHQADEQGRECCYCKKKSKTTARYRLSFGGVSGRVTDPNSGIVALCDGCRLHMEQELAILVHRAHGLLYWQRPAVAWGSTGSHEGDEEQQQIA
jgi:hypothetical protein